MAAVGWSAVNEVYRRRDPVMPVVCRSHYNSPAAAAAPARPARGASFLCARAVAGAPSRARQPAPAVVLACPAAPCRVCACWRPLSQRTVSPSRRRHRLIGDRYERGTERKRDTICEQPSGRRHTKKMAVASFFFDSLVLANRKWAQFPPSAGHRG